MQFTIRHLLSLAFAFSLSGSPWACEFVSDDNRRIAFLEDGRNTVTIQHTNGDTDICLWASNGDGATHQIVCGGEKHEYLIDGSDDGRTLSLGSEIWRQDCDYRGMERELRWSGTSIVPEHGSDLPLGDFVRAERLSGVNLLGFRQDDERNPEFVVDLITLRRGSGFMQKLEIGMEVGGERFKILEHSYAGRSYDKVGIERGQLFVRRPVTRERVPYPWEGLAKAWVNENYDGNTAWAAVLSGVGPEDRNARDTEDMSVAASAGDVAAPTLSTPDATESNERDGDSVTPPPDNPEVALELESETDKGDSVGGDFMRLLESDEYGRAFGLTTLAMVAQIQCDLAWSHSAVQSIADASASISAKTVNEIILSVAQGSAAYDMAIRNGDPEALATYLLVTEVYPIALEFLENVGCDGAAKFLWSQWDDFVEQIENPELDQAWYFWLGSRFSDYEIASARKLGAADYLFQECYPFGYRVTDLFQSYRREFHARARSGRYFSRDVEQGFMELRQQFPRMSEQACDEQAAGLTIDGITVFASK
jgi:hypothetical protein